MNLERIQLLVELKISCFFLLWNEPRGVLGEILNIIESVSGGFPAYFSSIASIRSCFKMYDFDKK